MRTMRPLLAWLFAWLILSVGSPAGADERTVDAAPLSQAQARTLEAKHAFKECDGCPTMVVVPAGEFTMGAARDEPGSGADERPPHRVTIGKPFAVGPFAVTFDEWDACVAGGGCGGYRPSDEGWGRNRRPVINVSWHDAKSYTAWLSARTGRPYRLLTEAEWEYAARAGTTTPFWWGEEIARERANYSGSASSPGEDLGKTVPVDAFAPNPWGLYQVHGNAYDWVEGCFNGSYAGAPSDGTAWLTGDCDRRGHRGGSWYSPPNALRSASRNRNFALTRFDFIGFRVARTLELD
jgi:formylglycine-generating enzyme required for sulfatase activity